MYVQKIENANMNLPRSCKWFEFTTFKYPASFNETAIQVITASPVTHQLANTYHPNIVLNQCVSILITQSHAAIDELTPKKMRNTVDNTTFLRQKEVEPSRSSASIFFRIMIKNQYHPPKNNTILKRKNIGN